MARLLSLNVGKPKDVAWNGRTVHTGIFKHPVDGPRMARKLNVDGDGQGDLGGHGGEIRAILVYQRESYEHWARHLGREDLEYGQFGENFTVDGLPDDEVHIGDRYRIGDAEFEVTQPRVTCFRVGMRLNEPQMPSLLVAHHRPGFYLRVITEGEVKAGDEITRTRVGRHRMTVAAIDALLYLPGRDTAQLRTAVDIPALSPGWQQSFRDLLDAAEHQTPATAPPIGTDPAAWAGFRPLRVTRIVPESTTVASIHLTAPDAAPSPNPAPNTSADTPNSDATPNFGASPDADADVGALPLLPRPKPGQHLTLRVNAAATPPPVRNYSLSAATAVEYRISVKRETHGLVSTYLHTQLQVGDTIDVAAPRGDFILPNDPADTTAILLLSAGVGVTPVLAMLRALTASHSTREIWWLHTARSAAEHAFAAEAHDLLAALNHTHEHIYYTAPPATAPDPAKPPATSGRITRETLAALNLPTTATAYLCGPGPFMTEMREALLTIGLDADRIHTELFGTLAPINPGLVGVTHTPPHQPTGPAGGGPQITFARSGLTVPWDERYATVLDLAEACDVPTRWSCRTGVCHTCQTPVLSGTVQFRPDPLEPPAPGTTLVCCAQPQSDLVLDL